MGDNDSRINELLRKSWEGEVLGEAFFAGMAKKLPDDKAEWDALTRLEATTRRLVEPVARAHGIEIDEAEAIKNGETFAAIATSETRDDLLKGTSQLATSEFLPIYRELTDLLGPDEAWIGEELVTHELALVHCVEALLAGEADGDKLINEYLDRHG